MNFTHFLPQKPEETWTEIWAVQKSQQKAFVLPNVQSKFREFAQICARGQKRRKLLNFLTNRNFEVREKIAKKSNPQFRSSINNRGKFSIKTTSKSTVFFQSPNFLRFFASLLKNIQFLENFRCKNFFVPKIFF